MVGTEATSLEHPESYDFILYNCRIDEISCPPC